MTSPVASAGKRVQTPCREQFCFTFIVCDKQGLINPRNIISNIIMIFIINSTRGQMRFLTCVARVTCLVVCKCTHCNRLKLNFMIYKIGQRPTRSILPDAFQQDCYVIQSCYYGCWSMSPHNVSVSNGRTGSRKRTWHDHFCSTYHKYSNFLLS